MNSGDAAVPQKSAVLFQFFDIWRVICALVVALSHAQALELLSWPWPLNQAAHHAVIIFFVISGYSVSASAVSGPAVGEFLAQRFSRLWATTAPILGLVLVVGLVARSQGWAGLDDWTFNKWYLHLPFHLLFLGQWGPWAMSPFALVPYWSLAYEAWYYLLFATFLQAANRPWRVILMISLMVALAPRMLILLPCWLLGVWLHRRSNHAKTGPLSDNRQPALAVLVLFCLGLYLLIFPFITTLGDLSAAAAESLKSWSLSAAGAPWNGLGNLAYSRWFLGDWLLAALFAGLMVWFQTRYRMAWALGPWAGPWLRRLASLSFGLYLLHYPALKYLVALGVPTQPLWLKIPALLAALILVLWFSAVCERTRPWWLRQLRRPLHKPLTP